MTTKQAAEDAKNRRMSIALKAMNIAPKHGGARAGAGRKPLSPDEPTVVFNVRLTVSQREKLARLGGADWLRRAVTRARE